LISFALKTLPTIRQSRIATQCLCGKPNITIQNWQRHDCKFEQWLRQSGILYPKSPEVMGVARKVEWERVRRIGGVLRDVSSSSTSSLS
jgi:hypothetical protein